MGLGMLLGRISMLLGTLASSELWHHKQRQQSLLAPHEQDDGHSCLALAHQQGTAADARHRWYLQTSSSSLKHSTATCIIMQHAALGSSQAHHHVSQHLPGPTPWERRELNSMDVALHEEAQRLLQAKLQQQRLEGVLQELPQLAAEDRAHLNRLPLHKARSLQGVFEQSRGRWGGCTWVCGGASS